jgi:hypothetical protein
MLRGSPISIKRSYSKRAGRARGCIGWPGPAATTRGARVCLWQCMGSAALWHSFVPRCLGGVPSFLLDLRQRGLRSVELVISNVACEPNCPFGPVNRLRPLSRIGKRCGVTGGLSSWVPRCLNHGAHTRDSDSKTTWWPTNRLPNCIEEGAGVSANDTPVAATKPEGNTAIPLRWFLSLSPKYVAKHKRFSRRSKAATNPSPLPPP